MAITKKMVFDAIESLEARGIPATNAAILEITGGSNATVQKYRREYYEQRQAQAVREAIILKDSEVTALSEAFATLLKHRVDGIQTQYVGDLQQLSDALTQASNESDVLRQTVTAQEKQIADLLDEARALRSNLDFHENLHKKEKQELQAEIQRLNELAYTHKGRADLLEERLKQYESKTKA